MTYLRDGEEYEGGVPMNLLKGLWAILAANLLVIFVQFAFAGLMIGGNDLAVNLHGPTGLLLVIVALIQMLLVIAMKLKGICPTWMVVANVGIIVAEVIEAICGHFHNTALHVPLALAIFGAVMRQWFWVMLEVKTTSELRA